jgi:hypothetical protein
MKSWKAAYVRDLLAASEDGNMGRRKSGGDGIEPALERRKYQ